MNSFVKLSFLAPIMLRKVSSEKPFLVDSNRRPPEVVTLKGLFGCGWVPITLLKYSNNPWSRFLNKFHYCVQMRSKICTLQSVVQSTERFILIGHKYKYKWIWVHINLKSSQNSYLWFFFLIYMMLNFFVFIKWGTYPILVF